MLDKIYYHLAALYRNFCKTFEAMAKTYTNADPVAAKTAFGGFVLR